MHRLISALNYQEESLENGDHANELSLGAGTGDNVILYASNDLELNTTGTATIFSGNNVIRRPLSLLSFGTDVNRDHFLQYRLGAFGTVTTKSNYFQRKGTILNSTIPSGTASGTVYGSNTPSQVMTHDIGDQFQVQFELTNYSNVTSQSRVNFPDGSFVSIPATCDGTINILCTARNTVIAPTLTWVYVIEFGLIGGGFQRTKGSYSRSSLSNSTFSLQTEMLTTANLLLEYAIVNVLRV